VATTFETFRGEVATKITGLTPVSFEGIKFYEHRAEMPFRDWARENPSACFRRFAIVDLFEYEATTASTHDSEWVDGTYELLIAYPRDFRYGTQGGRDQRDVMREDEKYVDETIGLHVQNYTDGHCVKTSDNHEEDDTVSFLASTYAFRFFRSR
jgi:hypothetical protein